MVRVRHAALILLVCSFIGSAAVAQDRFEQLPGHEQYRRLAQIRGQLARGGTIARVVWRDEGVQFARGGDVLRYDFTTGDLARVEPDDVWTVEAPERRIAAAGGPARRVARGRQATEEPSPDGRWTAVYRRFNVELRPTDENPGAENVAVTTEGNEEIKFGTASWVYGEELNQNTAMWWSPDSSLLAYYEFDDRGVQPYYLTPGFAEVQNRLYTEFYPKAGAKNPIAKLRVYHLESKREVVIDVGDDAEQYLYNIRFAPQGNILLFNRTNRHQNKLEVMRVDVETGATRAIITEEQETWQANSPEMRFLADGHRFLWASERTGYKHYELWDLDGRRHTVLTEGEYPTGSIVELNEADDWLYFTGFSAAVPISAQLHRVRLDGSMHERLTDGKHHYSGFSISPDHRFITAQGEGVSTPPSSYLFDIAAGRRVALAEDDGARLRESGVTPAELFTFKADDGATDLYGVLFFPSDFDPAKTYPLLIDVYGGPLSQAVHNRFGPVYPQTEFGFLVARIDNRGTRGRGKAFEGATYLRLGEVDLKDQADGVRFLAQRPYVDGSRVGITGHSYGGYMAALAVMKHPDVFHVAVAGAPVTDWRHYDTIYTERFLRTPQENREGYVNGSCMTYVNQFRGKLLLLHGMVDDNVHPSNTLMLAHALQNARKPFDMMLYPNAGHGISSPSHQPLRWEYLYDHLIAKDGAPAPSISAGASVEPGE